MVDLRLFVILLGYALGTLDQRKFLQKNTDVFSQLNAPTRAPLICQLSSIHSFIQKLSVESSCGPFWWLLAPGKMWDWKTRRLDLKKSLSKKGPRGALWKFLSNPLGKDCHLKP